MGQVPKYGIVGDGNVANHFASYFSLEEISFRVWSRKIAEQRKISMENALGQTDVILLLVSDGAIEEVARSAPFLEKKKVIHFSGSVVTPLAVGAHPLMTFSKSFYELPVYRSIPFVVEDDEHKFRDFFPTLRNPVYKISKEDKALYHALCVLSGNFTSLLWGKFFNDLETKFKIPRKAAFPYLDAIAHNVQKYGSESLSGPLARGDQATINRNLDSLQGDPYQSVYKAFVNAFTESKKI
jgi:predicted short-subunit dehydrogenase-like oxidoreductase (DUF2520 family)